MTFILVELGRIRERNATDLFPIFFLHSQTMYAINIQPFSAFAVGTLAGPQAINWSQSSPSWGIIAITAEH